MKSVCGLIVAFGIYAVASAASDPVGHMKPFGHHKPPSVVIDEFTRENAPKPEEFYENYVKINKAALFRDAVADSKAFKLWTDEYVRENFGDQEVRLEGKYEKKHLPPVGEKYLGRDTIRHFVDTYHNEGNRVYVVSDLPTKMFADMEVLPSLGACGEMANNIVEVNIWWSGGGSSSIIHKDAYHQMNCLLNGTKYWILIEKKYQDQIYKHPEPEYEQGGFSDVNPKYVNLKKYPKIKNVEWSNLTIYPGDCLFLPKEYYHQVNSSGTHNMAVSLLFARFDDRDHLDFSDCNEKTDYKTAKSLADFDVQLAWKGKGSMVMGRADLEEYKNQFLDGAKEAEQSGTSLDFDTWSNLVEDVTPGEQKVMRTGDMKKGFQLLDKDGDGVLSVEDLESMTLQDWQAVGDEIEPYEPSNEYTFEYSIIPFEKVWGLFRLALTRTKVLTLKMWLEPYMKMGGSENYGTDVFMRLSGGKNSIINKNIKAAELHKAMENYVKYWAPQYSDLKSRPTNLKDGPKWDVLGSKLIRNEFQKSPEDSGPNEGMQDDDEELLQDDDDEEDSKQENYDTQKDEL